MTRASVNGRCKRCRREFPGFGFEGQGYGDNFRAAASRVVIMGNTGTCPCGGEIDFPDVVVDESGKIDFIRATFDVLRSPEVTNADLEELRGVLTEAIAHSLAPIVVQERASRINPKFRQIVQDLANVAQILGLIYLLLEPRGAPEQLTPAMIEKIKNYAPPAVVAPATPVPPSHKRSPYRPHDSPLKDTTASESTPSNPALRKKKNKGNRWRHSQCTCGSGERFRDCCGAK